MLRNYRKPMVIAAPKIGLKPPLAVSSWQEFDEKQCFKPIIAKDYLLDSYD